MNSVTHGLISAICWGWADVLARTTGRALGAQGALCVMMATGTLGMTLGITINSGPWPGIPSWWTICSALLAACATLLLYEAMRRGPISLVSPAVGSYPAWALLISIGLGIYPSLTALIAMTTTMVGVFLVAKFASTEPDPEEAPRRGVTLIIALTSGVLFALTLLAGQQAILRDGETLVVWWGRLTATLFTAGILLAGPRVPRPTARPLLLACLQGVLDVVGLVSLFAGGRGLEGTMATVASSAFGVVTVILARLFYKEHISLGQGIGITAVFMGVVSLGLIG